MYRSFSVSTLGFQVCHGQDLAGFLVEKIERKAYVGEKKITLSDNTTHMCFICGDFIFHFARYVNQNFL